MDIQKGYCPVAGGQLYYEAAGQGQGVVLIHGFSLDTRMWEPQFEVLARRFRAVRYDLRGFGQSPPASAPFAHADDLRALLSLLGLKQAHLVGLSMGGAIALDIALMAPELVRSLVLVDAALGGYPYQDDYSSGAREVGLQAAKTRWLAHPLFGPAMRIPAVAGSLQQMVGDYSGWHWLNRGYEQVPDPLPYHRLGEISVPTLVVAGELEMPDFLGIADVLSLQIRGARKVMLAGAGHMSNMEAPEAFNAAILGFLDEISPGQ